MKLINYVSAISIPLIFTIVIIYGIKEKAKVYELFIEGAKEGITTVIKLFPTLLAIFLAVGMLRCSGVIEWTTKVLSNIFKQYSILPVEIFPLAFLKPISGSASIAMGTEIIKNYGVDSKIGKITATIMGSTETTLYIIAVYTSSIKIKKTRHIIVAALIADLVGIILSALIWQLIE